MHSFYDIIFYLTLIKVRGKRIKKPVWGLSKMNIFRIAIESGNMIYFSLVKV